MLMQQGHFQCISGKLLHLENSSKLNLALKLKRWDTWFDNPWKASWMPGLVEVHVRPVRR